MGGLVSDFDAPRRLPAEYPEETPGAAGSGPGLPHGRGAATRGSITWLLRNFTDVFTLLVDEPVAAAALLVKFTKRRLRNGKVVALKVQRPDCERVVALDLFVLRWWARLGTSFLCEGFGRDLDLVSVVDDFGALIYREIDYRAEARNARQFAKLYQGYENTIRVPKFTTS